MTTLFQEYRNVGIFLKRIRRPLPKTFPQTKTKMSPLNLDSIPL